MADIRKTKALIEWVASAMWHESERLRRLVKPIEIVPWERCPEHLKHAFRCMATAGMRSINVDARNARPDPTFVLGSDPIGPTLGNG